MPPFTQGHGACGNAARSQVRLSTGRASTVVDTEAELWGPEQSVRFMRGWLTQGLKPSVPTYHLRTVWKAA